MRGAIAKGEFDNIPAVELPKLQKQLIVGTAYVKLIYSKVLLKP